MAVVADLALARNLLAVTQRFREAGARDHAIHDVLARLQHGAAAQGLESFVELGASATEQTATEPSADGAGERSGALATVTLYWEHFMLDLPLFARHDHTHEQPLFTSLFGTPNLTLADETSPAWSHSTLASLGGELVETLRLGKIERCCALLGALRSWQHLLVTLPPESPIRAESFWNSVSDAMCAALGETPIRSCEGLCARLYRSPMSPPGEPPVRVILRPETAEGGAVQPETAHEKAQKETAPETPSNKRLKKPSAETPSLLVEFDPPLACDGATAELSPAQQAPDPPKGSASSCACIGQSRS